MTWASLPAFISELKRRHVIRVGLVYLVVAWVVVEVASTIFPHLQLPDIAVTFVIALLLLGLPVALVLAWAYDITPQGVERTAAAGSSTEQRGASDGAAAGGGATGEGVIRTIVALPFANLTRVADDEYLSDGITEELMGALARVPGLRVVGRTSAFAFKNRAQDIREIGALLGVDAAVEGSVRRAGSHLRINVQLTDARAGYQLWSKTYDRELADVLALEEEIAHSLVTALQLGGAAAGARLVRSSTGDSAAYRHYLQGRFSWNRRSGEALRQAIVSFEAAIAADPAYALAYAGLADCYSILVDHGLASPGETLPRAVAAAERAVELDPTLAETHTSLALVCQVDCRWTDAEAGFRAAIELDPDYVVAHHRYALLLAWLGRDAEALRQIERARELDPLSPLIATTVGWVHYWGRRPDHAAAECRRVVASDPAFVNARVALGLAFLQLAAPAEAVTHLQTAAELSTSNVATLALLAVAYAAAGRHTDADAMRRRVDAVAAAEFVSPYYLAVAALATGDRSTALALLERAAAERSPQIGYLKVEPLLDPLRGEPGFDRLLLAAGLVDGATSARSVPALAGQAPQEKRG